MDVSWARARLPLLVLLSLVAAALILLLVRSDQQVATNSHAVTNDRTPAPTLAGTPPEAPRLRLSRGPLDEQAPFAGVFVVNLAKQQWMHIAEEPPAPLATFPNLLAASRDGTLIAITTGGDVRILSSSGEEIQSWRGIAAGAGAFSPDGLFLALAMTEHPALLNVETGEVLPIDVTEAVWDVDWSPDGSLLLLGTGGDRGPTLDGDVFLFSMRDGKLSTVGKGLYPRWSPAGDRMAFVQAGALVIADRTGSPLVSWRPADRNLVGFNWSPDGALLQVGLITLFQEARLTDSAVISASRGTLQYTITGSGVGFWSPNVAWLAVGGNSCSKDPAIFLVKPDGSAMKRIAEEVADPGVVAWSPDSTRLLIVDAHLAAFPIDGSPPTTVLRGPRIVLQLEWHANGIITFSAKSVAGFCESDAAQTTELVRPGD